MIDQNWRLTAHRITKYDPAFRNEAGHFLRDEWTAYSDIGKSFNDITLTEKIYLEIESKYVTAVRLFLDEVPGNEVIVTTVEKYTDEGLNGDLLRLFEAIQEGKHFQLQDINSIIVLILRGHLWCEVFSAADQAYAIRFGYDYYMYFNAPEMPDSLIKSIEKIGLFVD